MNQSKDGKINLRKITNEKRQADGKLPINEQIDTNIDHLPINRIVEIIKDRLLDKANYGMCEVHIDFFLIHHGDVTDRQEYELLNVLHSKLSEVFSDTLSLCIYWTYDDIIEDSFMGISVKW